MSERPRLYLIDGYSNIFRAFYAIRNLSSSSGEPTNAVFGFLQILRKILRDDNPEFLGVALDVSSDTVRRDRYAEYKANRAPMPEDLRPQIPLVRRVLEGYRIPIFEMPKYEADDVLGTLSVKGAAAGFDVVLVSADKDLFQLVNDHVFLYHSGREKLYDAKMVEEDFGAPPNRVIDVLALMGDSSDNIPGVKGIGEKGAKGLIREYGSFDALLERASEVKRKSYREGLEHYRDDALMSKELVTIHTDLPIELDPEALRRSEPDYKALLELFYDLDFRALAEEIEKTHGAPAADVEAAMALASADEWTQLVAPLGNEIHVARISDDATGHDDALGLAVLDKDGKPAYADFGRDDVKEAVLTSLRDWIADEQVVLHGHDLKEVLRLVPAGGAVSCRLFDTMLASYILTPELRSHSFADIVHARLRRKAMTPKEAGWVKGAQPGAADPLLLTFAAERVALPHGLTEEMTTQLDEGDLREVYETLEEPLVPVLRDMEEVGIELDSAFLAEMSTELAGQMADYEEEIYKLAGESFNIGSPRQLGEILFEKQGLPVLGRTRKTKSYSTSAETLEELAARGFDLPERILHYRELSKLKSTYVDALPELVDADGRIHTRFNQAVAATGRLSSANPNLQNIPIRTELGRRVRGAFRAAEGYELVAADYSQVELRVLAHIAGEQTMIEAFQRGEDIHATTAAAVFGGSPLLVNPDQRRMAKVINFGIVYGMSDWGLSRQLGITKKDAGRFIAAYMERYPGVARYTEETLESAKETLVVKTLYGRIRRLPDIRSRNYALRENAKRMAINARIQGTAADLLKLAMIAVDRRLKAEQPASRLLLTVHDELVLEAPTGDVAAVSALVREEMEGVAELDVPLIVDAGSGVDWYSAKS